MENKTIMSESLEKTSKFLSLVLRHQPDKIGLTLDKAGWASIAELVSKAQAAGVDLTVAQVQEVVATNDKQRFAISPDGERIRANQGHSLQVDLGLTPQIPPERLYHGTALRFLGSILREGLKRQGRQQVHLSVDPTSATQVGQRHGKPIVLEIDAGTMHKNGFVFFLAENNVWLTEEVPPQYLKPLR